MKKRKQPIKRNRTIWQQFQGDDLFKKKTHKNYYKKLTSLIIYIASINMFMYYIKKIEIVNNKLLIFVLV